MSKEITRPINVEPEALPESPEEALAQNFYQWERRGRGWQMYQHHVQLEPPFRPFFHYLSPRYFEAKDDGRMPTLLDRIARRLDGWFGRKSNVEVIDAEEALEIEEPDAERFTNLDYLYEIEIALSQTLRINKEVASQLFTSLTYCALPLSFEVIGTNEAVIVQLVCRERDRYPLREQFAAYFPEAVLTERRYLLSSLWLPNQGAHVVVDFGLCHEFFVPLRTFSGFETDPLASIIGALDRLGEGELGVLQVLFEPCRHSWAESVLRSVTDGQGKAFFDGAPELVAHAKHKISSPLYAAVVRVAAKAPEEARAWQIAKALGGGLAHFNNPVGNELMPLENDGYSDTAHWENLLGRMSHRTGMILNAEELVSLVHPPSASVRARRLIRQSRKTKAPPKSALENQTWLGLNDHEGEEVIVSLTAEQRVKHTHVIGASGTGKSTFLHNMICQDIWDGNGVAVLDPHGDLIEQLLERIPEERWGDVILFDPSDEDYPIGFNILQAHSEIEKQLLSSDLVAVFRRLSTAWGDQMNSVLGNAIAAFLESERGGTLADLRRFLVEKDYRAEFLTTVRDQEIVYYWQREFPLLSGKPQGPLLTRLDTFLRPKLIRYMVAQKENKLDFAEIMNSKKIFLAKLSQGAIGEENAFLLGSLLVSKIHQMTLARQDMKEADRSPFFLYIDEFHHFLTPSMASILSGVRKYRLGLILAHQELRQLGQGSSDITNSILSNPYTRVCFRLGDADASKLAAGYSFFEAKDFQNLETGEAICRLERADHDFNLRVEPLKPVEPEVEQERRERILQLSRQRYGTRRDLLDEEWKAKAAQQSQQKPTEKKEQQRRAEPSRAKAESTTVPPEIPVVKTSDLSRPPVEQVQPVAEIKPKPSQPIKGPPPALGRGGAQHKYLQQFIKQMAEGMGYRATIELGVLEGAGQVDVALEKADVRIACEISISTPAEHELGNITKCLHAGFTRVAIITSDDKHLQKIQKLVLERVDTALHDKLRFHTPQTLLALIEEMQVIGGAEEQEVKGYKVKVSLRGANQQEQKAKQEAIKKVLSNVTKRIKKAKEK